MAPPDLKSVDEWSEGLHHALLSERFVLRRSRSDASTQVLIKFLPHAGSRTLGVIIVPLQTFVPLYEGLSYRTLLRRVKADPVITAESQDEREVFQTVVERLANALEDDTAEIECEVGRGEAQLSIHSKSTVSQFSLDVDLTALDREDGPRFIRDHLFAPLASLSQCALEGGDVDDHARRKYDEGRDSCSDFFGKFSVQFTRHTQLLSGIACGGVSSAALPPEGDAQKQLSPPPSADESTRSPFEKLVHKPSPQVAPAKSPPEDSDHTDDEEELVVFHPTQGTQSTSSHTSDQLPPSSSTSSTINKASSLRDQRLRHNARRDAKSTPMASEKVSRTGKLMAGAGYGQFLDTQREEEDAQAENAVRVEISDPSDDDEEKSMLASKPKAVPPSQTQSQTQTHSMAQTRGPPSSPRAALQEEETAPSPPRSPEEEAQTFAPTKSPPASTSQSRTQSPSPPPPPATAKDSSVSTASTLARGSTLATAGQAGRGASSYRRGLAKRKRI